MEGQSSPIEKLVKWSALTAAIGFGSGADCRARSATQIITIDGVHSQASQQSLAQSIISAVFMAEQADDQTVAISASTRRTGYESNLRRGLSGRALIGAELGAKLGVSDIDGSAPKFYRYELGGPSELHATLTS
jgi:hypothetical protein